MFTRHHYPAVGEMVTLLTLTNKIAEREDVWCEETNQLISYGWSFCNEKWEEVTLPKIPAVGEVFRVKAVNFFQGGADAYYKFWRKNHNTFVVIA